MNSTSLNRLDFASVALLVMAAVVYFWPVTVAEKGSATPNTALAALAAPAMPDTLDAHELVRANMLSASRRAPQQRYVSPELAADNTFNMPPAFAPTVDAADADSTSETNPDTAPALFGTINTDGVWRALLRLSDADANPSLFKEGDRRGGFQVVSIRSNAVVVAGPTGRQTLRLAQPARGDSIGKLP